MKALCTFLAFILFFQPIVHACENIEPIDPESVEYDPKNFLKKSLSEEGRISGVSAEEVGRSIANAARTLSPLLTTIGYAGDIYYVVSSAVDLADAIRVGDVAEEVFSSLNLVAAFAIPAVSTVNPIVGIVTFAALAEAQAIYSLVEESKAYHRLLDQLADYRSNLQKQIDDIEQKMISRVQSVALKQNEWHLLMSENGSLGYRFANLSANRAQVISQIQDVVDTCALGLIEYELKPYIADNFLADIPHVTSNQLFDTVTEMELTLSEILNELSDSVQTASFASNEGFLDVVNSAVVDGVESNLRVLLPPVVSNLLATTDCTSNLVDYLDYSVSEYERKEFLQAHLGDLEELAWLYYLYYFADNSDLLGGLTDPAVGAAVVAASAWVPVVGLVLLATAGPAIGAKLLSKDQEVLREIIGMKQFMEYCGRLDTTILNDSELLSLAIQEFVDSQAHPFVSSDELKSIMMDAIQYARHAVLLALPHSLDEKDIAGLEVNDAYALALANIETLQVSDGDRIQFAMHGDFPIEADHFDLTPEMEQGATNMMVHFDDERATLETSSNLMAGDWSLATSNSPMMIASDNLNKAVFFRANPKNLEEGNEDGNGIASLAIQKSGKDDGLGKPDREDPNDAWTAIMPGSITNEGDRIVVEMFVNGNSNYHDSVVAPYVENTISDMLFDDFEEYVRSIADPVSHTNAFHWLEDVKDEAIEEIAIKEGLRTTAGFIIKQISGFLASDERDPQVFTNLAENIEINWAIVKDEVVVHVEGEPVDYYTLDRIPGTQYLVDQFVGWANNMGGHIEQNGWRYLDRYPVELFSFIEENEIEREAVNGMYMGMGIQLVYDSLLYRSSRSRIMIGSFPMEVMRDYAVRVGGLDAETLRGPFFQYKYDAVFRKFDEYPYFSKDMGSWRPPVDYELNDGSTSQAGWVGSATVTENTSDSMWPVAFHGMALGGRSHSIYSFPSTVDFHVELHHFGTLTFVDGDGDQVELLYHSPDNYSENKVISRSSNGAWGMENVVPAQIKTYKDGVINSGYQPLLGYEPKLQTSLNFIRLKDDSRLRGFEVEFDLNLAEFIWMARRRDFNYDNLNEVKMRVHAVMHQRYTHSLPHEGEELASTKKVDRDIYCVEEKVIMDAADLNSYRNGTLPDALAEPIKFDRFSTTTGLPSHDEFDISSQQSYAELKAVELIFNGDTRYVFVPETDNAFIDNSSLNGKLVRDLPMYFFDPNPQHPARISWFNNYGRSDLVGMELPAIIQHYQ